MKSLSIITLLILNITCFSQTISYVPVSIQGKEIKRSSEGLKSSVIYSKTKSEAIKKVNDFCLSDSAICEEPIAIENKGSYFKSEIIYRIRKQIKITR